MKLAPIARGLLTGALVTHLVPLLAVDDIFVGRGIAPPEGGWASGQPGTSAFVGYTVIKTGKAVLLETEALGRAVMGWKCFYQFSSSGGNDSHADDVGDRLRVALTTLPDTFTLRGVEWTRQKTEFSELGATVSSTAVDPPFWSVTDAVSLWLSRNRAS
jgi:hypothetical protein